MEWTSLQCSTEGVGRSSGQSEIKFGVSLSSLGYDESADHLFHQPFFNSVQNIEFQHSWSDHSSTLSSSVLGDSHRKKTLNVSEIKLTLLHPKPEQLS